MYNKNHISPGSSPADSINRAQYCVHVGLPDYSGGDDTARTRPVYTLTAGSRPPVWFYGYCPSSPAHHHQTELPSLTTTLPAAPAKTLSTCPPTENIYISKNLHVYTKCGYKEGLWNTVPRPGLFLWLVKVTLIYMRERLSIGEHHQEISYYKGYYGNDWKRWFYLLHWNNLNTHLGICIWTFPIVDTDL